MREKEKEVDLDKKSSLHLYKKAWETRRLLKSSRVAIKPSTRTARRPATALLQEAACQEGNAGIAHPRRDDEVALPHGCRTSAIKAPLRIRLTACCESAKVAVLCHAAHNDAKRALPSRLETLLRIFPLTREGEGQGDAVMRRVGVATAHWNSSKRARARGGGDPRKVTGIGCIDSY